MRVDRQAGNKLLRDKGDLDLILNAMRSHGRILRE